MYAFGKSLDPRAAVWERIEQMLTTYSQSIAIEII